MDTIVEAPPALAAHDGPAHRRQTTAALTLLALGVVYGDIGTSPLYAVKETFNPEHGIPLTPENILGGLSAIFWTLMIVVSLKYVMLIMRADNRGEGGIMALLALATVGGAATGRGCATLLLAIGVFGASLFYGDAVLTPAISVLSAVEGLEVGTSAFKPYVVPIAVGILIALFAIQRHGTGVVGTLFGPVCALWFVALGAVGRLATSPRRRRSSRRSTRCTRCSFVDGHGYRVVRRARLGAARRDRRRGAVRRHGPFRQAPDPHRLVRPRAPGAGAQLLRPGRAADRRPGRRSRTRSISPSRLGALSDGRARDGGDGDRLAGDDLRRLLDDQAGDPARLPAAHDDPAHLGAGRSGQIYVPAVNWMLLLVVVARGDRLRLLVAARLGLRRRGDGHDADHDRPHLLRHPLRLGLSAVAVRRRDRRSSCWSTSTFFSAAMHKVLDGGWFPLVLGAIVFT